MQLGRRDRKIFDISYKTGWKNVWHNILHPRSAISKSGTRAFFRSEILPGSFALKHAQFWPNYQNHLIGGGATWRAFREWYEFHDFRFSGVWALGTAAAYHLLNEVVENNAFIGTNVDPIADLLIFDPLGILLFSNDSIARFFSKTLNLRDWSFFPTLNPATQTIENNGQNYAIKIALTRHKRWHLFYNFGNHGIVGLSHIDAGGRSFSFGGGFMARNLKKVNPESDIRILTTELVWNAGLFYDRKGSLLASLIVSGARAYKGRMTIYPGMIKIAGTAPAIFMAIDQNNALIAGFTLKYLPFGLAF